METNKRNNNGILAKIDQLGYDHQQIPINDRSIIIILYVTIELIMMIMILLFSY